MIDWIERLPESLTGPLVAAGLFFGFNYAVLAERAMEKDGKAEVIPHCADVLGRQDSRRTSPSGIGTLLGVPELDRIEALVIARTAPRFFSARENEDRCACGAKRAAQRLRFDYAVHTSTFRLVVPQAVASIRDNTLAAVLSGVCGVLPSLRQED